MSPSTIGSATPVTVTVCGWFQLDAANVTLAGETTPSVRSLLEIPIVTPATGWLWSVIANVAVPPASVVTSPDIGVTVMPAASLSALLTATSAASMPL